ncbi:mitochondrial carrier domain-containing protein [Yarrowia lipolytica]|uniref:YALI0B10736p n=2 Tax=Yarrowia lipolytica TaxID=4952 RepID=Q6CF30_YARLI|nr:YALI0B10736p [Yarrowia lipolytica CLIB122]AOW01519.1 hypothetical protein YALI1_B14382g [Yarrowia lipolytica]KAB8281092.1 mitochondrial carrier domain-containing protein [Yarrowia lipolytica]KAE8170322.1 mitochondrial carrier domain-containing protein [Yarrowia lipolytica]KAJ8052336.1 mitochondrial carrier domain-containing protein [Yarrowia lipolytica]QNP97221.1 Citrate/oxoglutarate carrier protein [Yarrowia lipolytica]|eukprot:XP_500732.1 YALI0B10736p [Yarrowia lipolytica CLIB122]
MGAANLNQGEIQKKPVSFSNILLGAGLNMFEVTTLGQPLEVVKTTMAANRGDTMMQAIGRVWSRGGIFGFYQGLIPWAWIEASTKGAVLLFVSSEAEYISKKSFGMGNFAAGITGGISGGLVQAYLTMGFCTCMKTVEITRSKQAASGVTPPSSIQVFKEIFRKEGIRGINKGVNAVAIRQMTNWGSRFGFSRLAEEGIRKITKNDDRPLNAFEKIAASTVGGGLSAWNQPIEVIRVEMQSKTVDPNRPKNLSVWTAFKYIYQQNGIKGLYRGVTPRIGLGIWQTVCMVGLGDIAKDWVAKVTGERPVGKH